MQLQPHENALEGGPATFNGQAYVTDPVCTRIDWLTRNGLELVASRPEEAATLYRDPTDGRYWERTYPHRNEQEEGDGPPQLRYLSEEKARERYQV